MSTYWREWLKGRAMGPERVPRVVPDDACPLGEPVMANDGSIERLADDVVELKASRDKHGERLQEVKGKVDILEDRLAMRVKHWHDTDSVVTALQLADSFRDGRLQGIETLIARVDLDLRRIEADSRGHEATARTEHANLHERVNRLRADISDGVELRAKALEGKIELAREETKRLERAGVTMLIKILAAALMGGGTGAAIAMKVLGG